MDISSLSLGDYALIVANFYAAANREKDQEAELRARGFSEAQIKAVRKKRTPESRELMGLRFSRPLIEFKYDKLGYVLTLLENYERGILPFPGSTSEQPAQIIEIFNLLQNLKADYQKRLSEAQENHGRHNKNKPRTRR